MNKKRVEIIQNIVDIVLGILYLVLGCYLYGYGLQFFLNFINGVL